MKLICLIGSPRGKNGNTGRLAAEVLRGARSQGATAEVIALKGNSIRPCRACDQCHIKGCCPQRDDFEALKAKILAADGLVLASPNYINQVSTQLKAFIDRCCGIIHCLGFEGKYGASVVTSGGGPEKMIADYMNQFLISTGIHPVGSVCATMMDEPAIDVPGKPGKKTKNKDGNYFTPKTAQSAYTLGERLVKAWQAKKRYKRVDRQMNAFRARMHWLVTYRINDWVYEYEYWKKKQAGDPS